MNGDVKATRFGKASAPMVVALVVAGITVADLAWLVPWRGDLTNVIMIPLAAVIPRESTSGDGAGRPGSDDIEYTVYVVESGKAWPKPVTIDIESVRGTRVRVKSGLKAGDRLIVDGHRRCGPGDAVKTDDATAEGAENAEVFQEKMRMSPLILQNDTLSLLSVLGVLRG